MQKLKSGDLVTLRAFSQIKNKSFMPVFVRVPRDVPDDEGFWQVVGNAYSGDIFIFLEEDPSIHWDVAGGSSSIQRVDCRVGSAVNF